MRQEPSRRAAVAILSLVALGLSADPAPAQQSNYPTPMLKAVFPPGGRAGTTVEVTLDGADLDAAALLFSPPGPTAERLPDPPADPKKKPPTPAPVRFRITIPKDAPPGIRDLRVVGKWGISNPRAFVVGELPEVNEKEPNSDVPQAQRVEIGMTMNGVVGDKTDVDYFVFAGKQGQRVVVRCAATTIDSRLTAHLLLITAEGRELANNRFYRDGDAVLSATLPADGDYYLRLCDFAYQTGGPESVYRLTVTDGPWLDAVYPPVVVPWKPAAVTLFGRNLPGGEPVPGFPGRDRLAVTITPPAAPEPFPGRLLPRVGAVEGFGYRLPGSNPVFVGLADGPVVLDNGANDTPTAAQSVPFPCDLCGRIEARGDRDFYTFTAKQGEVVVIEGFADRLRAPTDLYLQLRRADNRQLVGEFDTNPDMPPVVERFFTYTDDPIGRVTIPADGTYELLVGTRGAAARPGVRDVYHISLRHEQPDFQLVLVGNAETGAGLTLRRGSAEAVQIVCFRKDGFAGEVTLTAEGLPPGVACAPQVLGPKLQQGALVLAAAADAKDWAGPFRITGTATVGGRKVVREARAGCLVFPSANNAPALSRLARSLALAVRDPGPFRLSTAQKEAAVPVGGSVVVKVKADAGRPDFKDQVAVDAAAAPAQANGKPVTVPKVNVAPGKDADVRVQIPANAPAGRYTLVLRGTGKLSMEDPATKKKANVQYVAVAEPVALTVYSSAAELALGSDRVEVRPGGEVVVPVKLKRLHGYAGPLTVELVPPSGASGLSAATVTVPAGAGEAKLVLKAAAGTKPAAGLAFTVRATAKVENVTLKEEMKLAVAVADIAGTPKPKPAAGPSAAGKAVALIAESSGGWRYTASVSGDGWRAAEFDDKGWKEVKAPLGNGEPEVLTRKGTEVPEKGQPVYCRRAFDVPADLLKQPGVTFRLRVASDNSAVVYLNGKPADEDSGDHEFSYWNRDVVIPPALLRPGRNVVAVRVDNTAGSSDLYLDLSIEAVVPVAPKK